MKKIVSFIGDFNDPGFEGLVSVKNALKKGLLQYDWRVVENKKASIYHVHTSSFLPAVRLPSKNKFFYTLYSNCDARFFSTIRYYCEYLMYFWDGSSFGKRRQMAKHIFFTLLGSLVPLFLKRYFLQKARVLIVPTVYLKRRLKLHKAHVIPIGIDCSKFKITKEIKKVKRIKKNNFNPKPEKIEKSKKSVVAYFGHNTPLKGIPDVVKAFRTLPCSRFDKRIYLSQLGKKVKKYIKKHDPSIKIFGYQKNIVEAYNDCDIIVLPYRSTVASIAIPLVLLEAMACERAIITTNLPHLKEICKDSVLYIRPYDWKHICHQIFKLQHSPQLKKALGLKARRRIIERYNDKNMIKHYAEVYGR